MTESTRPGLVMELVSRAHLAWNRQISESLAPFGLNPKRIFVLRKLSGTAWLAPSEIARLTSSDRPTTTVLLNTLEKPGWIRRESDPENGKAVRVSLTEAGRKKLATVPERLWRSGKTDLDPEACFTGEERHELVRLLRKLNEHLTGDAP